MTIAEIVTLVYNIMCVCLVATFTVSIIYIIVLLVGVRKHEKEEHDAKMAEHELEMKKLRSGESR